MNDEQPKVVRWVDLFGIDPDYTKDAVDPDDNLQAVIEGLGRSCVTLGVEVDRLRAKVAAVEALVGSRPRRRFYRPGGSDELPAQFADWEIRAALATGDES